MHKRNIALTALALALAIAVLLEEWDWLTGTRAVGLIHYPAIVLSVILSGGSHSPGWVAGWSSFLTYTLGYWALIFATYAVLLDLYLVRQSLRHVEAAKHLLTRDDPDSRGARERIGLAITEIETRRRKHFFLKDAKVLDLSQGPELLALQAMATAPKEIAVKGVMNRLESKLKAEVGADRTTHLMTNLRGESSRGSSAGA